MHRNTRLILLSSCVSLSIRIYRYTSLPTCSREPLQIQSSKSHVHFPLLSFCYLFNFFCEFLKETVTEVGSIGRLGVGPMSTRIRRKNTVF
jgi:hypothetical protein